MGKSFRSSRDNSKSDFRRDARDERNIRKDYGRISRTSERHQIRQIIEKAIDNDDADDYDFDDIDE